MYKLASIYDVEVYDVAIYDVTGDGLWWLITRHFMAWPCDVTVYDVAVYDVLIYNGTVYSSICGGIKENIYPHWWHIEQFGIKAIMMMFYATFVHIDLANLGQTIIRFWRARDDQTSETKIRRRRTYDPVLCVPVFYLWTMTQCFVFQCFTSGPWPSAL